MKRSYSGLGLMIAAVVLQVTYIQAQKDSLELAFYEAARAGNISFLRKNMDSISFKEFKQALGSQKTGELRCFYNKALDEYTTGDAGQPFGVLIKKFPAETQAFLSSTLVALLSGLISKRQMEQVGTTEIRWLTQELEMLKAK